jgi:hypothetical protein
MKKSRRLWLDRKGQARWHRKWDTAWRKDGNDLWHLVTTQGVRRSQNEPKRSAHPSPLPTLNMYRHIYNTLIWYYVTARAHLPQPQRTWMKPLSYPGSRLLQYNRINWKEHIENIVTRYVVRLYYTKQCIKCTYIKLIIKFLPYLFS